MRAHHWSGRWVVVVILLMVALDGCGGQAPLAEVVTRGGATTIEAATTVPLPPTPSPPVATPPTASTVAPAAQPTVTPAPPIATAAPPATATSQSAPDDFLYVPSTANTRQPATVLVALHGVGGDGRGFCKELLAEAERNGWVVLAPTFRYGNWHDPAAVVQDDLTFLPRLKAKLDALPERTGLRLHKRVLIYGFSRGGQIGHRFALAYPRQVLGVATLSAGAYTLPTGEWVANGARRPLPLPYGTADLADRLGVAPDAAALGQVTFWIGVGGSDNRDGDVPAAWTTYIGPNRLARARAFKAALDRMSVPAALTIFPGVDHRETAEMRVTASAFLRGLKAG